MTNEDRSYQLPEKTLPAISFQDHAADLIKFKEFVDDLGIKTHNTRIARYTQYFLQLAEGELIDERKIFKNVNDARFQSALDWQLYLLREAHELMWILRGLKKYVPKGIEEKIEKIVSGSDFAALDKNTESRDTQFELRIASYFCQTGCSVDISTDTDIIAVTDKHAFFVECKRIAGSRNLKDNLVKARDQIVLRMPKRYEEKHAFGVIAADVTKLGFSHNGLTMALTSDHARDVIQNKLKDIKRRAYALPIFTGRPDIIECLLQIHMPSVVAYPPATTTRFSSCSLNNLKVDRKSRSAIAELNSIFNAGGIIDDREIPAKQLKYRTTLDIPSGTDFFLEQELITAVLSNPSDEVNAPELVVASMKMNDVTHEFSVMELRMVMGKFKSDQLRHFVMNVSSERIELVIRMFMQRYPYENSQY
ncbi:MULTISPECIES: hypothetical protein [Pseudomonas]|uniref:NERD domain-containing protein n=1 Tax=Pseudomonas tritici TaxID=2745518 RepID=A0A8H9YZN5_9PSED|nr:MULTISPECIES: hypothetical protein [Pseudomonas]MBP2873373.1 hypothetical protein [Pseudomonas sp. SWRI144]QXH84264.1 hypothetical protein HU722_0001910 [Pseudomonas tritici]